MQKLPVFPFAKSFLSTSYCEGRDYVFSMDNQEAGYIGIFLCGENVDSPQFLPLAWRRLYGEKTVRKAGRARLLSEGEESEALNQVAFDSLGQKKCVLEP